MQQRGHERVVARLDVSVVRAVELLVLFGKTVVSRKVVQGLAVAVCVSVVHISKDGACILMSIFRMAKQFLSIGVS